MSGHFGYRACRCIHPGKKTRTGAPLDKPNHRLALLRQTGGDPNLTGLLRVFKNYYPEIIVGDLTKGRAASFKVPSLVRPKAILKLTHSSTRIRNGGKN